ncbi:MAG: class I SAM-dependent methyltransferase [Deltaproteobacteria bacterium]|nr:class I SAM-dependent methyltransferase [Deltaproteobacteria bacterium]
MRSLLYAIVSLSLATTACKKKEADPGTAPPVTGSAGSAANAGSGSAAPSPEEKVAAGLKKADEEAAEEQKRWTPELTKQVVDLRDAKYADAKAALTAILASPHRMPKHPERDAARHPVETLTFFGITPTQTVIEIGAGGGWYSELLAPLLANGGKYIVAGPDTNGPKTEMSSVYGKRLDQMLAKSPELFDKVERVTINPDAPKFGPDASADLVIAMREMHNWQRNKKLDAYLAAAHAALKDGGTFGVEQHRAKPGTMGDATADSGYLAEDWVIEKVKAAGFELVEKSEINANPKDTKDYPKGVWTLPPNFREGETDKAKYAAIGESDRMTLTFKKVAKPAAGSGSGSAVK